MKRVISVFLCLIIAACALVTVAPASQPAVDGSDVPIIHVCGSGALLVRNNEEGKKETVYPLQIPDGYIEEEVKEFLPIFAQAFFTQDFTEFSDVLVDILVNIFEPMALDENGEVKDGSRADWTWNKRTLPNRVNKDGKYSATAYKFHYDWRLDPLVIADTLRIYIEDVLSVTGKDKVVLYGRCLGSNVVAAYMQKYDGEYVQEVIHYASSIYGVTPCSKGFAGELFVHADGVERFLYDADLGLDQCYSDVLQAFVTLFNKTYGLDITCWAINNKLEDIYLDIIPEVLLNSYGTMPAYWSMVHPDDYEKAMETVFYGQDKAKYAGLIEKIENYRENVLLAFPEFSMEQAHRGIEFSNIVKYGKQSIPFSKEESDELSDSIETVENASFGATTAKLLETFDDEYISKAVANGTDKFISPDKQIDASTCISPETTWFVKNLEHYTFPESMNILVSQIANNEGFTVFSDEEFPQYLVYDEETSTISAMTADNMNTTEKWNTTFFEALKRLMSALFEIIRQSLATAN